MKILNYTRIVVILLLTLGFTACDEDEESVENAMIGRIWAGDIGMNGDFNEPIFSEFRFDGDGFGTEYQYYISDGAPYDNFRFQWYWENGYGRNLVLDYGKHGISFMDNVSIRGRFMRGVYFFENGDPGFNFTLEMQ